MAQTRRPRISSPTSAAKPGIPGANPGRFRMVRTAGLLAGLVAVVLATGLATAGTTQTMDPSPLPLINTAAFVFLTAATVVSGTMVFAFWRHLLSGLAPAETRPATIKGQRPTRPLRDI